LRNNTAKAPASASAATAPRSETKATQSLLGHGFAVRPSSAIDGSLRGAKVGYFTGQFH
jgi:hypothetical protein